VISNAEQQSAFAPVVCRAGVLAGEPLANCVAECEPNDQGDCSFQHEGTDRLNMDRCRDEDPALACHGENAKGGVSGTLLERKEMRAPPGKHIGAPEVPHGTSGTNSP
jgi:hypothetical protein